MMILSTLSLLVLRLLSLAVLSFRYYLGLKPASLMLERRLILPKQPGGLGRLQVQE
jgi:hypothetical protein